MSQDRQEYLEFADRTPGSGPNLRTGRSVIFYPSPACKLSSVLTFPQHRVQPIRGSVGLTRGINDICSFWDTLGPRLQPKHVLERGTRPKGVPKTAQNRVHYRPKQVQDRSETGPISAKTGPKQVQIRPDTVHQRPDTVHQRPDTARYGQIREHGQGGTRPNTARGGQGQTPPCRFESVRTARPLYMC